METLLPFKELTDLLEGDADKGRHGTLWEIIPAMDLLLKKLEDAKSNGRRTGTSDQSFVTSAITNAWIVMDKYYSLTSDSAAYAAALVLHPQFKWHYVEKNWEDHPEWIVSAKSDVQLLWERYQQRPSIVTQGESQVFQHSSM